MINLLNAAKSDFYRYIDDKKIFVFGAGPRMSRFCKKYPKIDFMDKICAFSDNNKSLYGHRYRYCERAIPVVSIRDMEQMIDRDASVVLIISSASFFDIIRQLDQLEGFDGIECFILQYVENHYEEDTELSKNIARSKCDTPQIPKTIHYCWVGGNPFTELEERCIDSWKRFCPDYEIVRWDETNYDWSKNSFMKKAYEDRVWGYASDYARLDIVQKYGGFYMDTDVELVKSLEDLRYHKSFAGVEGGDDLIAFGLGYGAVAGNELIREIMNCYDNSDLLYDANGVRVPCPYIQTKVLKKHGYCGNGKSCIIDGEMMIYPPQYFSARNLITMAVNCTPETYSIHHFEGTWATAENIRMNNINKENASKISERIMDII